MGTAMMRTTARWPARWPGHRIGAAKCQVFTISFIG
jgi:hypothetical protein